MHKSPAQRQEQLIAPSGRYRRQKVRTIVCLGQVPRHVGRCAMHSNCMTLCGCGVLTYNCCIVDMAAGNGAADGQHCQGRHHHHAQHAHHHPGSSKPRLWALEQAQEPRRQHQHAASTAEQVSLIVPCTSLCFCLCVCWLGTYSFQCNPSQACAVCLNPC